MLGGGSKKKHTHIHCLNQHHSLFFLTNYPCFYDMHTNSSTDILSFFTFNIDLILNVVSLSKNRWDQEKSALQNTGNCVKAISYSASAFRYQTFSTESYDLDWHGANLLKSWKVHLGSEVRSKQPFSDPLQNFDSSSFPKLPRAQFPNNRVWLLIITIYFLLNQDSSCVFQLTTYMDRRKGKLTTVARLWVWIALNIGGVVKSTDFSLGSLWEPLR